MKLFAFKSPIHLFIIFLFSISYLRATPAPKEEQKDKDGILLEYQKILKEDTENHRKYITTYYDKLYTTAVVAGSVVVALFGLVSFLYQKVVIKHFTKSFQQSLREKYENDLDNSVNEIKAAAERIKEAAIATIDGKLSDITSKYDEAFLNVERLNRYIEELYNDRKSHNLLLDNNATTVEYLKSDGSHVRISETSDVTFKAISTEREYWFRRYSVTSPGKIANVIANYPIEVLFKTNQKFNFRFSFKSEVDNRPFTVFTSWEVYNGFLDNEDWYIVSQVNDCLSENFNVKFLKQRTCSKVTCRKINTDGTLEFVSENDNPISTQEHDIFAINIPISDTQSRYKISWIFNN